MDDDIVRLLKEWKVEAEALRNARLSLQPVDPAEMDGEGGDEDSDDGIVATLYPTDYLEAGDKHSDNTALVVLNCPIRDLEYFLRLYSHARFCVAADGGANHLHDLLIEKNPSMDWQDALRTALPNAIHGDLDSLANNVRKRYDSLGVPISKDPDQYSTDLEKSIKKAIIELPKVASIVVIGTLGGRVDHGIGLLHELYREQKHVHAEIRFWLFSEASASTILQPGTTRIYTPLSQGLITRNVGILPLYGKAIITTTGLEWDINDWPTEFGGQVSTSNHIVSDWISITTNLEVLFTVEKATLR